MWENHKDKFCNTSEIFREFFCAFQDSIKSENNRYTSITKPLTFRLIRNKLPFRKFVNFL